MTAGPLADLFARAADALDPTAGTAAPDARDLLDSLGYAAGDAGAPHRAALLRAAARLRRVFRLSAPDAPGLVFMGGEADPASVGASPDHPLASLAGSGLSLAAAVERCVGEGIEYLSQVGAGQVAREPTASRARLAALDQASVAFIRAVSHGSTDLAWIPATRLSDGAPVAFPADLCVRRLAPDRDFTPPLKLGTGCAAGVSVAAATLHALLELVERDAASRWWRGGARGRLLALDGAACRAAALLLARLREGADGRATWLLDISTDLAIPCVAAVSVKGDGRGLACGLACRLTMAAAAESAVFELCQMELGQVLAEAKRRERGEAGLNDGDRGHLRRATLIDATACPLLHPLPPTTAAHEDGETDPSPALRTIVGRLEAAGIESYAVDLTHPDLGVPVVRVLAPALQLDPCAIVTERLAATIRRTGGGEAHTAGVALL
ncbi:MAG: YcaO-like family protein [Acetobacteraceae bacterium]